nr:MAG TPA: hypothetical protein [Caudoviricetes sp.]
MYSFLTPFGTELFNFSTNIQMKFGIRETRLTFLYSERTYFTNCYLL